MTSIPKDSHKKPKDGRPITKNAKKNSVKEEGKEDLDTGIFFPVTL